MVLRVGLEPTTLRIRNPMHYPLCYWRIWYLHSRRRFSASKPVIFYMVYEPTMENGAGTGTRTRTLMLVRHAR